MNFAGRVENTVEKKVETEIGTLLDYNNYDESNNEYSSQTTSAMFSSKKRSDQEDPKTPVSTTGSATLDHNSFPMLPLTPSSPHRPSRANISKMGRSINRPVEEKPLLDEIREVLAQSYLMFLLSDLRHMSATGRISTKYENLAIDSDVCKRDTAKSIACVIDNVRDDDFRNIGEMPGLSPALIMAIVILEIRDEAVKNAEERKAKAEKKGDRYTNVVDIDNDEQFVGYENNSKKQKVTEESMESLMKCYSRMVSEDLLSEIPSVQRRRATLFQNNNSQSPGAFNSRFSRSNSARVPPSPPLHSRISRVVSAPITSSLATLESVQEGNETSSEAFVKESNSADGKDGADRKDASAPGRIDSINSNFKDEQQQQEFRKTAMQMFSPGKWNSQRATSGDGNQVVPQVSFRDHIRQAGENSKQIADRIKTDLNQQVDNLLSSEVSTQKEFRELTDVIFEQGEVNEDIKAELGATYSRTEMVEVIRSAVEARHHKRLQFLSKMFRPGSISKLMAESHARIVWVNDWYPLKDLTYGISVDPHQKRVMVVFRGAITTTDWLTTFQFRLQQIRNPVKDDYEGKNEVLRVYSGFYKYLFRKRKDTGTTKYHEIANLVHKYGIDQIGSYYNLFVTGHSLGGALSHLFSFFASTDDRFTKNGPVKAIVFASPYMGGHSWADAFRHQERMKKVQFVNCRNSSDVVPRTPPNFAIGRRGPLWRHIGIGVTLPKVPKFGFKWKPLVHYWGKENSCFDSTMHGYRRNVLFYIPYLRPWTMDRSHTLFELQDRLIYGEENIKPGGGFMLLKSTLDELYERLEENDFQTFSETKWWGIHRKKGESEVAI